MSKIAACAAGSALSKARRKANWHARSSINGCTMSGGSIITTSSWPYGREEITTRQSFGSISTFAIVTSVETVGKADGVTSGVKSQFFSFCHGVDLCVCLSRRRLPASDGLRRRAGRGCAGGTALR